MTNEKRIAMAVDRMVTRVGLEQMGELTALPRRSIQNWMSGICAPPLPKFLVLVRACIEADHPDAAADALDAVLGLVGYQSQPVPTDTPDAAPALLVMHAAGEVGDVVKWAEGALRDGVIDHVEAAQGEREIREAHHALNRVEAVTRAAALRSPQRPLELGSAR